VLSDCSLRDCVLVGAAALYHDIGLAAKFLYLSNIHLGFLELYDRNEEIGRRIAMEQLPAFGFSSEECTEVGNIIMATRVCRGETGTIGYDSLVFSLCLHPLS